MIFLRFKKKRKDIDSCELFSSSSLLIIALVSNVVEELKYENVVSS